LLASSRSKSSVSVVEAVQQRLNLPRSVLLKPTKDGGPIDLDWLMSSDESEVSLEAIGLSDAELATMSDKEKKMRAQLQLVRRGISAIESSCTNEDIVLVSSDSSALTAIQSLFLAKPIDGKSDLTPRVGQLKVIIPVIRKPPPMPVVPL